MIKKILYINPNNIVLLSQLLVNRIGIGRPSKGKVGRSFRHSFDVKTYFTILINFILTPFYLLLIRYKYNTIVFHPVNFIYTNNGIQKSKFSDAITDNIDSGNVFYLTSGYSFLPLSINSWNISLLHNFLTYIIYTFYKILISYDFCPKFKVYLEKLVSEEIDELSERNLIKDYIRVKSEFILFKHLLKFCNLKSVVVVPWYSFSSLALCGAARNQNICCCEFQHGVSGDTHSNYSLLKFYIEDSIYLPSVFYCWSCLEYDFLKTCFDSNPPFTIHKFVNPDLIINDGIVVDYSIFQIYKSSLFIFVSLGNYCIPKIIDELITNDSEDIFWIIRPHPRKKFNSDKYMNFNNVLFDNTITPINYLKHCDIHITESSSLALLSLDIGVSSIIIHNEGFCLYESYIKQGKMIYIDDIIELKEFLNSSFSCK